MVNKESSYLGGVAHPMPPLSSIILTVPYPAGRPEKNNFQALVHNFCPKLSSTNFDYDSFVHIYWSQLKQILFTTYSPNLCSKLLFPTFAKNFCSKILPTTLKFCSQVLLKLVFYVHSFCSQLLLTHFALNFKSILLFTTFVHYSCLQRYFKKCC